MQTKPETPVFPPRDARLFVILGPYGAGKSEISLNLALAMKAQGRKTALCDLDIVNPYFRSREQETMLMQAGIWLMAPEGELRHADLPSIPQGLGALISDQSLSGVIDLGGDKPGARVLAGWAKAMAGKNPQVCYVFNRARFDNASLDSALLNLRLLEAQAGLPITGILHNTHLLGDTDAATIREGARAAKALADASDLPILAHCIPSHLVADLPELVPVLPMTLHLKRPWE